MNEAARYTRRALSQLWASFTGSKPQRRAQPRPTKGFVGFFTRNGSEESSSERFLAVDTKRLLAASSLGPMESFDRSRVRTISQAFRQADELIEMPQLVVKDGKITVLDGRHRLNFLSYRDEIVVLVRGGSGDDSCAKLDEAVRVIDKACGTGTQVIRYEDNALYAWVELNAQGHLDAVNREPVGPAYRLVRNSADPANRSG